MPAVNGINAPRHEFGRTIHRPKSCGRSSSRLFSVAERVAGISINGRGTEATLQIERTAGLHRPTTESGGEFFTSEATAGIAIMLSPSQFGRWIRVFFMVTVQEKRPTSIQRFKKKNYR
jgi:hypothetical protein